MVTKLLAVLAGLIARVCKAAGLSAAATVVVQHVVIVFVTVFVAQVVGAWSGSFNWPTLAALATSAAAAAVSAVVHYLIGLVPPTSAEAHDAAQ